MMPRVLALSAVALLCSVSLSATPEHPDPDTFPTILSEPRVDVLADGRTVINFVTAGEYRGLLTLTLSNDSATSSGEWMLSVRYTDNTDPATGVEPPSEPHAHETTEQHETASAQATDGAHPHLDFVRLVDKGVIGGSIDAVAFDVDSAGNLTDFRANLRITTGTLTFDGATGTGLAELARGLTLVF